MPFKFPPSVVNQAIQHATTEAGNRLGSPITDRNLLDQIENQVKAQMDERAKAVFESAINQVVNAEVAQQMANLPQLMQNQLELARGGLTALVENTSVKEIAKQNAMLLHIKFTALVAAGFTEEQTLALLVADVGRGSRRH